MSLYEREDFKELLEQAAAFHSIPNPAIVEKDYYVTEALRLIATCYGDQVIFKGGTSLSKGWSLIRRFSEDIDLYVDPGDRGYNARNTLLKSLATTVGLHPNLNKSASQPNQIGGVARATTFEYVSAGAWTGLKPTVLLEVGIQSGTFPTETRVIRSLVAEYLAEKHVKLETEDLAPFTLPVLHYKRTVIEKMYALHDKVERGYLLDNKPIGTYARHYYDISQLVPLDSVQALLKDRAELRRIADDYKRLTGLHFPNQLLPVGMSLSTSNALFPNSAELREALGNEYSSQCAALCYGEYPTFEAVLDILQSIREQLDFPPAKTENTIDNTIDVVAPDVQFGEST